MPDAYSRRARLAPAVLAAMPAVILVGGALWAPASGDSLAAIAIGAIALVICGLVRETGRRLQPELWKSWGGSPTVARLRWAGNDKAAVSWLHEGMGQVTGNPLPTEQEEATDPASADARYERAVLSLRELTRDARQFGLVAEENAEYGFRRNCLGLRPYALAVATVVAVVSAVALSIGSSHPGRYWASLAAAVAALAGWYLIVRSSWVRSAADRYAERLLGAVEPLRNGRPAQG
jgi:hypothetical protein